MRILSKKAADTIFLSGSPRTGTTWLGEIIGRCPGMRIVFEPFHKSRNPRTRALTRRYLHPDHIYPHEETVLEEVLTGRIGDWVGRQVGHRVLPSRLAVKAVRGNFMLEYIHRTFRSPIVFITRHPCAVVASRLKMGYPSALQEITAQSDLMEGVLGPFAELIEGASTLVEQHAALWCAENLLPLSQMDRPWQTTVFYEELFSNTRSEVDRVFEAVSLLRTAQVDAGLTRVSRTARKDSAVVTGDGVLERWRKDLGAEDVKTVLDTVAKFGIETYGDDPMPVHPPLPDPGEAAKLSDARPRLPLWDRLPIPDDGRRQIERAAQRAPRQIPLTQPTFCPRLFGEAFVSDRADVYGCCHFAPFSLESLESHDLSEIWNSPRLQAARRMSLTRTLYCHERCNLLDDRERAMRAGPSDRAVMEYSRLRRIKLLIGELCNIGCVMCDQNHGSRRQLPLEMLQTRIDWEFIEDIEFQGGEPLAMNEARKAYKWLTEQQGKKVNFLTNGTIMSVEWAERIARGSSWLYFSINGATPETHEAIAQGAKFHRIRRSIARILEARSKLGTDLELVSHFTIVPANLEQAPDFPAFAKELGFDRAEFGYDISSVPRWVRSHPSEASRLKRKLAETLVSPPLPVVAHRLGYLGLVD